MNTPACISKMQETASRSDQFGQHAGSTTARLPRMHERTSRVSPIYVVDSGHWHRIKRQGHSSNKSIVAQGDKGSFILEATGVVSRQV